MTGVRYYRDMALKVATAIELYGAPPMVNALHFVFEEPTTAPDHNAWLVLVDKCNALGIKLYASMRLHESSKPLGWLDAARWEQKANWLGVILNYLADAGLPPEPIFDIEAYGGQPPTPDPEALQLAAKPFLDVIRARGARPAIYPAYLSDGITIPIVEAAGNRAKLWSYLAYNLSEYRRYDPAAADRAELKMCRWEREIRARFPMREVEIGHGEYNTFLRAFGSRQPDHLAAYGPLKEPAFIFDSPRVDNLQFGTPNWISGRSLHSSNDVRVWRIPPLSAGYTGTPYPQTSPPGPALALFRPAGLVLPGIRPDIVSKDGMLLSTGQAVQVLDALVVNHDMTACFAFSLPPYGSPPYPPSSLRFSPIFGACKPNSRTWQIEYDRDSDRIVIAFYQGTTVHRVTLLVGPPKTTPLRVAVAYKSGAWRACVKGGAVIPCTPPVACGTGAHLYGGAGVDLPEKTQTVYDAMVCGAGGLEIATRSFNDPELVSMSQGAFPRLA